MKNTQGQVEFLRRNKRIVRRHVECREVVLP
jgi:hypothetical protein